ncbi:arrestin domain-containing protein 4-like [Plakobranchus ocellatus]|uniref:Arrestin domain-containing protein 4-like n=1 Tax=Plakobranchus ocellatus TaxID=259542 RepID=A0AAV4BHI8_9GAST|nr:arrestin domain-containing protein 4-like [Plakobranchus ocellatus]
MSAVTELSIVLQHDIDEQYQYQPGEIIRGVICVTLSKSTSIREITVKVYSEGNVSWKDPNEKVYQAQEIYVDSSKAVVDTTYDLEPLRLPAGRHEFPLEYILPENVPSSYIGKYGNVTYTMKVTVVGANSRDTAISSEPFLVLRRQPIPAIAQQPLAMTASRRLPCCCSFGTLDIRVSLDRAGGVPGEDIFLQAEIKNQSGRTVTAMQASLIMTTLFRAQNNSTEFRQVVSKKRDEMDVTRGEGRRWTHVRLPLPPYVPESKLEFCDIIELDYLFQFRVELTGGSEVRLEAPFWVGAQPQGLEIPENKEAGPKIDRQWTVRGSISLSLADGDAGGGIENGGPGGAGGPYVVQDYDEGWGVGLVPELRSESAVVNNPLFQHHIPAPGAKLIPEEFLENTKL